MAQETQLAHLEMMLRTLSFAGLPFDLLGRRDRQLAASLVKKGFARIGPSRVWSMDTCRLTAAGRRLRRHILHKASMHECPRTAVAIPVDAGQDWVTRGTRSIRLEMLLRTLGHLEYPFESLDPSDQRLAVSLTQKGFARIGPSRVWGIDTCRLTAAGWRLRSHVIQNASKHEQWRADVQSKLPADTGQARFVTDGARRP